MEPQSTRSRSFGGCTTCRSRHVKCDETRPACTACRQAGLACGGYEKTFLFDFKNIAEDVTSRFRRPVSSEAERRRMSEWLTLSVPPKSVLRYVTQIDEECENSKMQDIQIRRGPFGAFNFSKPARDPPDYIFSGECEDASMAQHSASRNEYESDLYFPLSPGNQGSSQDIFHQFEEIPSSPSTDFWNSMMSSSQAPDVFPFGICTSQDPQMSTQALTPRGDEFLTFFPSTELTHMVSPSPYSSVERANDRVPQDAVLLLKHYTTVIISLLTPFRHKKTPWHILFLPHVKNCLAALTLGESLDEASLAIFYGTLAMSAFSLGGIFQSEVWLDQGQRYKQEALGHVKLMLQKAYDVPKFTKYKSVLMALLTMMYVSRLSGNQDQMECYFLEAEKFIRLRGLKRKKSRKVRLLHHCYAFERILYESTFICLAGSNHRHDVRRAIESSGLVVYGQDSLSFNLKGWQDLAKQLAQEKSQEEGENDLHLERPGHFPATLYPEVFGIPETWLQLLSQVIRLGNEKEAAERCNVSSSLNLKDFLSRAKALERCINQQPQRNHEANTLSPHSVFSSESMLVALHHALKIYFYRRIYDIEASMLQCDVLTIRDCLISSESGDQTTLDGSAGFIWPAFIAACEAEHEEVQTSFTNWFRNSAERSGVPAFASLLKSMEQLWQAKRRTNGAYCTWLELMRTNLLGNAPS